MKKTYPFYQEAKEVAKRDLEEGIRQENMLCEEERVALRRERQEEAAGIIESIRKKSEAISVPEERKKKERRFWVLQDKAVKLARKLSLNLEAMFEVGTGRLVFSASDFVFTRYERRETYGVFKELLDEADLIWFEADTGIDGQIRLYLEYSC